MTIQDLWNKTYKILDRSSFNELIRVCFKTQVVDFTTKVNKRNYKKFLAYLKKLERHVPLAYLLHNKYFFESDFYVNKHVLIPRFESELLVESALTLDLENKHVLDLCCGSGCLGISLKLKVPTINLILSDVSHGALKVCQKNLKKHKLQAQIVQADFLQVFNKISNPVDLLIINPPYIDFADKFVDNATKTHEPHRALFAKDNGLYFFKELFKNIDKLNLSFDVTIICEFGFQQQTMIQNLFKNYVKGFLIEFKQDYTKNPRYFIMKRS